jgi:selenium metabolism protein YedF
METIDCRGLACPQPVLKTRDHIQQTDAVEFAVRVDNDAAVQNVARMLTSQGFSHTITGQDPDFLVTAHQSGEPAGPPPEPVCQTPVQAAPGARRHVVFVGSDRMGLGDDDLGRGLMKNFLLTLKEMGPELWRLVFVNSGVKLCLDDAETLGTIQDLVGRGVSVLVCGTCLNHFGLSDRKAVGETTNMLDVVTSLQVADKVISV